MNLIVFWKYRKPLRKQWLFYANALRKVEGRFTDAVCDATTVEKGGFAGTVLSLPLKFSLDFCLSHN